jgi:2-phosphoglycerate kinase
MQQSREQHQPGWRLLLIGGSSGTGRGKVARALARHLGLSLLLVDDLRVALQEITQPGEQAGLHYFQTHPAVWQKSPETLSDGLIAVGNALARPLAVTIARHLLFKDAGPLILEGDGIIPALAAQKMFPFAPETHFAFAPIAAGQAVRSIFLVEPDEAALARHMVASEMPTAGKLDAREQQTLARANWLYGQWIRRQADHYDLPVIEPQPWENVLERLLQAVQGS